MSNKHELRTAEIPLDLSILKDELIGMEIIDSDIGDSELRFLTSDPVGRHLLALEEGEHYRKMAAVKDIALSQLALMVHGIGGFHELNPYFDWCKTNEYDPLIAGSRDLYIAVRAGLTSGEALAFAEEVQAKSVGRNISQGPYREDPFDSSHRVEHLAAMAERERR
jgi:hypothetical protein